MQQNMKSFLKTHQISVHTKNQLSWVDSLAGGGWKQPFSPKFINFFINTQGENWAKVAQKRISCEHSHQIWIVLCEYFFR